jgi:hypothetical protein
MNKYSGRFAAWQEGFSLITAAVKYKVSLPFLLVAALEGYWFTG